MHVNKLDQCKPSTESFWQFFNLIDSVLAFNVVIEQNFY